MPRALVVFNPVSGAKSIVDIPSLIKRRLKKHDYEWDWFDTVKADRQPLEPFSKKKYDRVIVVGGDGTISDVATFLIRYKMKVPLIVLSQGSANLIATGLGIALFNMKRALTFGLKNMPQDIDVMEVNGKYIGLIAIGRGYDAFMMEQTPRSMKRKWGLFAYVWVLLKTYFVYRCRPYRITVDGKRHHVVARSIIVLNILPFESFVSRWLLKQHVKPNDGVLNLFVLKSNHMIESYSGKEITIKAAKERHFEIDGDLFKSRTFQVKVLPKALRIVYKKKFK